MTIFLLLSNLFSCWVSSGRQQLAKKILEALTHYFSISLTLLNYFVTIATFANLALVTLSVWLFPRQVIFEITPVWLRCS
jgi:phage shock protein PspC (stress-responsive transcriptional regulator)